MKKFANFEFIFSIKDPKLGLALSYLGLAVALVALENRMLKKRPQINYSTVL